MTPDEFLEIINGLPLCERMAYAEDLAFYGRGFVEFKDGRYRRVAPKEYLAEHTANKEAVE